MQKRVSWHEENNLDDASPSPQRPARRGQSLGAILRGVRPPAIPSSAIPSTSATPNSVEAAEAAATTPQQRGGLAVLTRTPRSLRAVRTGYAYQPLACCTYQYPNPNSNPNPNQAQARRPLSALLLPALIAAAVAEAEHETLPALEAGLEVGLEAGLEAGLEDLPMPLPGVAMTPSDWPAAWR